MRKPEALQAELNRATGDHARLVNAARNVVNGLVDEAPDADADQEYIDLWISCWQSQGTFLRSRLTAMRDRRIALVQELADAKALAARYRLTPIYGPPAPAVSVISGSSHQTEGP